MNRLGGEILANKVRAHVAGKIVILGYLNEENEWVYTNEGILLANEHSNFAVEETAAPKTRKKAVAVVESVEPVVEPEIVLDEPVTE
jgi:hypothetical protein